MHHTVLVVGSKYNVYRQVTLPSSPFQQRGREHSITVKLPEDCDTHPDDSKNQEVALPVCPTRVLNLQLPAFVFPLQHVEVWRSNDKHGDVCKGFKRPILENMCGMLKKQKLPPSIFKHALPVNKKKFGYAYTLATSFGNISFDKRITQPLFRGVLNFECFRKLLHSMDVNVDSVFVSLVVFSANVGRKLTIGEKSPLFGIISKKNNLRVVGSMDDQNNTIRFCREREKST